MGPTYVEGDRSGIPDRREERLAIYSGARNPSVYLIAECYAHAFNFLNQFHLMAKPDLAFCSGRASKVRRTSRRGSELTIKEPHRHRNVQKARACPTQEEIQKLRDEDSATPFGKHVLQWNPMVLRSSTEPYKNIPSISNGQRRQLPNHSHVRRALSRGIFEVLNGMYKTLLIRRAYKHRAVRLEEL